MSTWDVEPTSGIQGDLEELRARERKMHDDRERERERERCMMTYTKKYHYSD